MSAGRPPKDAVDGVVSLAQQSYLREGLRVDRNGLALWLKRVPEGAMGDRDVRKFLALESRISPIHASILSKAAPGLSRLTLWPWRTLSWYGGDRKLWRIARNQLALAQRESTYCETPLSQSRTEPKFRSIASAEQWVAAETFFRDLVEVRRSLSLARVGAADSEWLLDNLVSSFTKASAHPTIGALKSVLSFCLGLTLAETFSFKLFDLTLRSLRRSRRGSNSS